MNEEQLKRWFDIITEMEPKWFQHLGMATVNKLATIKRGIAPSNQKEDWWKPIETDEELLFHIKEFKELLAVEISVLSDIRGCFDKMIKDTRIVSEHSQSIKDIKERNLKSIMVKKAVENYDPRSGDNLVIVHRQEEDAS